MALLPIHLHYYTFTKYCQDPTKQSSINLFPTVGKAKRKALPLIVISEAHDSNPTPRFFNWVPHAHLYTEIYTLDMQIRHEHLALFS
jgi:hypothetical protein